MGQTISLVAWPGSGVTVKRMMAGGPQAADSFATNSRPPLLSLEPRVDSAGLGSDKSFHQVSFFKKSQHMENILLKKRADL